MNDIAIPDLNGPAASQLGPDSSLVIVIVVAGAGAAIFFASLYGAEIYRTIKRVFRRARR
jgi:hypothetical protein